MAGAASSLMVLVWAAAYPNAAHAADKLDLASGWNFEVEIGGNTGTPVFAFEREGATLAGQYRVQFPKAERPSGRRSL